MGVDEDVVKRNTFAFKGLENEVLDRPECVLWERFCAETVLIADHHELEIEVLADKTEVTEYALRELEFLEGINLFIGRFLNEGAVAIYEEDTFHAVFCFFSNCSL